VVERHPFCSPDMCVPQERPTYILGKTRPINLVSLILLNKTPLNPSARCTWRARRAQQRCQTPSQDFS
jgi:hypothetical protein